MRCKELGTANLAWQTCDCPSSSRQAHQSAGHHGLAEMDPNVGEPEIPQEISLASVGMLHPESLCPLPAGTEHVIFFDDVLDVGGGVHHVQVLGPQTFDDRPSPSLERLPVGT